MIGVHSSSRPTMERITRVFAWPRSPRRMMSWPARMAFSSWGTTVSSKPSTPGTSGVPAAMALAVLRRISSATGTDSQPEERRSAIDPGRSAGGVGVRDAGSRSGRRGGAVHGRSLNPGHGSRISGPPVAGHPAAGRPGPGPGGPGRGRHAGPARPCDCNDGATKGMPTSDPSAGNAMAGTTAAPRPAATKERTPAISAPSLTRCGSTPASRQADSVTAAGRSPPGTSPGPAR